MAEEPQARRLLAEMVASGRVAVDIETAPNRPAVERLGTLLREQADTSGALKALRKLKASEDKIGALTATAKRLAAEVSYTSTRSAGLDPHRARIRLIQVYGGGDCVLVVDLDHTGAGVLELLDGVNIVAHNAAFELAFLEAAGVALGEIQCTAQMARLTLGEHATSLADCGGGLPGPRSRQDAAVQRLERPSPDPTAGRLRGDRRRRHVADRREDPAPPRHPAVGL